jgi:pimeloyl-ACP methyl ester carboxylesterase
LGGIVAFATGRADARALLGAVLAGEEPQYEGEGLSTCRAYDAPFAGLGENGVVGAKRFPLCIPLNDPVSGDAEGQRLTYQAVNRTELPVHFIWGEADTIFSKEWGQTWASRIPHATYDGLESAQHFLQETHGREIANIVLQYAQ